MVSMRDIVEQLKVEFPETKIIIGGAPVNDRFREEIGADKYSPNPQGAVSYLNSLVTM
jgi:methanogenic corrinoid protein MtbC1